MYLVELAQSFTVNEVVLSLHSFRNAMKSVILRHKNIILFTNRITSLKIKPCLILDHILDD